MMSFRTRFTTGVLGAALLGMASFMGGSFPRIGESMPSANPPWFDASWGYRMQVTGSTVLTQGGPILDHNLVIRLTSAESAVFNHSRTDGADLLITKQDGVTPLPREMVSFDPTGQQAEIWVRVDTLSTSVRDFYVYYGNPLAVLPVSDPDAWPTELLAVYHMNDDPGAGLVKDSGTHQNDAYAGLLSQFTSSDTIAGAVGGAWRFNGTTHWIDGDGLVSSDSSFTISAWFACWNQLREGADFAFSVESEFWHLSAKRNDLQRLPDAIGDNGFYTWTPNPLPDTLLHYYTWSLDGVADTMRFYYDGVEQAPFVRYSPTGERIYTGNNLSGQIGIASPLYGNNNPFDLMEGIVDEFRVRQGVVSSARIASEYRNQKSKLFLTYGPEEPYGVVPVRLLAFQAAWTPLGTAEIRWEMAAETRMTLSLYRESNGKTLIAEGLEPRGLLIDPDAPDWGADYHLEARDASGETRWFGPIALSPRTRPLALSARIAPNPFHAGTRIAYQVDRAGEVRVRILDLRGREVARPWTGWVTSGAHETIWDGRDSRGNVLPVGVYFVRLETHSSALTRKLIRVP